MTTKNCIPVGCVQLLELHAKDKVTWHMQYHCVQKNEPHTYCK